MKTTATLFLAFILLTNCGMMKNSAEKAPLLTPEIVLAHLHNGKAKKVIIDSDTYNEMDDQYAVAYALGNPNMEVISINAAPFHNDRSTSYEVYFQIQNELMAAYNELRDEMAREKFGKYYRHLDPESDEALAIRGVYPMKISEAEPKKYGGN